MREATTKMVKNLLEDKEDIDISVAIVTIDRVDSGGRYIGFSENLCLIEALCVSRT